jgi:hypothetical protein
LAVGLPEPNADMGGACMADNVGERFLEDSKEGGAQLGVQERLVHVGMNLALYPGPVLEFVRLPFQGGAKAEVVEHAGPQFGGDAAHRLDGRIDVRGEGPGAFDEGLQIPGNPGGKPGGIELTAGQGLTKLVMDFAGDAGALLLADRLEVHR